MIRRAFRGAFGDDEIDDIYSSAWLGTLRALERRQDQLSDEEIRKYVLTAVANHASKELRRRNRRPTAPLEAIAAIAAIADDRMPLDERAAKREDSRIARDLLGTLPPRRRAVMLLRYGWGLEPRQVCGLVNGLSPRAYRREITRGVDELTEKLRLLERGEWCADREPVLKAYAAGLADAEQQRQARQHLSHCRHCAEFVGKLSGHLYDLGSSLGVLGGVEAMDDGGFSLADRLVDLAHRLRESAGNALGGHPAEGAEDVATRVASLPGGARGAGAAGTGVLAKLAGLGTAGKLAAVCVGGGAAATACLATGIVPADLRGGETRTAPNRPAVERHLSASPHAPVGIPPSQPDTVGTSPPPPASGEGPADDGTSEPPPASEPEAPPPIAPSAPPGEQEFGVASAASGPDSSGGSSSSGGTGSAIQREFGP